MGGKGDGPLVLLFLGGFFQLKINNFVLNKWKQLNFWRTTSSIIAEFFSLSSSCHAP